MQALTLPKADPKALRPFEVVGVPIDKPGFYVLELASPALGRAAREAVEHVRTTVLVTNLGVHLKQGRENNLVWVTTLDKGKPVPNAQIRVSDCNGDEIASGKTDAQGLLKIDGAFESKRACSSSDSEQRFDDYFVSARVNDPKTARHGVRQLGLEPRNRIVALQRADRHGQRTHRARIRSSTARCCAPAKPCR